MSAFDFDRAMCIYLGGPADSSAIQIGAGPERLVAEYGASAAAIQCELDAVLRAAVDRAQHGTATTDDAFWQAPELAGHTSLCLRKIEAHVIASLVR